MLQSAGGQWSLTAALEYSLRDGTAGVSKQGQIEAAMKLFSTELVKRKSAGMTIAEMIAASGLDRDQVRYVTRLLRSSGVAEPSGRGRFSKWVAVNG